MAFVMKIGAEDYLSRSFANPSKKGWHETNGQTDNKILVLWDIIRLYIFVLACLCLSLAGGENPMPIVQNFSGPAIGTVAAGIACASTTVIYQFDRIALRVKIRPHFAVGLGAFTLWRSA